MPSLLTWKETRLHRSMAPLICHYSGIVMVGILTLLSGTGLAGCATTPREPPTPSTTQTALVGKTKTDVQRCATVRPDEHTVAEFTILQYYKEASLLEESFPGTKSSVPRAHHGCWATLRLLNERITEVQYRSVPQGYLAEDHCDEIFAPCVGQ